MNQPSAKATLSSSRLVRFLSDLEVIESNNTQGNFGDQLGRLIDFSNSIILSAAHSEMKGLVFEKRVDDIEPAKQEFLKVRSGLVESIAKSTTIGAGTTRIKLPKLILDDGQSINDLYDYEPYHRFYASHQRDIDFKLRGLRQFLRDEATGYSPKLAQLAILDTALEDTLSNHTRSCFNSIPRLLGKRYKHLSNAHREALGEDNEDTIEQWVSPQGWLTRFYNEIQALLLAELEVRLQPSLGLLEALNEEVNKH